MRFMKNWRSPFKLVAMSASVASSSEPAVAVAAMSSSEPAVAMETDAVAEETEPSPDVTSAVDEEEGTATRAVEVEVEGGPPV